MTPPFTQGLADTKLMLRVSGGDPSAFEQIYDRYQARAFGLALRVTRHRATAEEVIQDAFLTLWRGAERYDSSRGSVSSWLLTIVHNRSIDALRRSARHDRHAAPDSGVLAEQVEGPGRTDEDVIRDDEARIARGLLRALPVAQRETIELAYFGGLTQVEIASRSGVPLGTVKSRMRLALSKLGETAEREEPALGDPRLPSQALRTLSGAR